MAFVAEGEGGADAVAAVRGGDGDDVAHAVELHLLLDAEAELAVDLAAEEGPGDLATAEPVDEFLVLGDEFGLVVGELEGVAQADFGGAVFAVEGGDDDFVAEGQLGLHDRQVGVDRPVEDAGRVGEGEVVAGALSLVAGTDERELEGEAGIGVLIDEEALFLAVGLVEVDVAGDFARGDGAGGGGAAADGPGEAGPLAEVAGGVEIGHPGGVVGHGVALVVADDQVAVLLVEVGHEEIHEQAAHRVDVKVALVVADPSVAEGLEDQADAVHLAVGSD